ncbi:zinc finger, CCHC-type, retrotransposon gag domain protein [Tanacetum coccineum]
MPPRHNRVNNEADPAFAAAVEQAVAALLPNLTARITDEIRQNENNANRRNGRRGSGNDGDAQPTDIHVWLERLLTLQEILKSSMIGQIMKETTRGTETTIVYDHQNHHRLIRELMIEGIVTDMATAADMATGTDMALIDGVVIDRAVTDMIMVVTYGEMVVRRRGVTKISSFRANIIVVLMGHQARADTRIITHVPHATFMGNFIQERRVTGLLVLALNVDKLGIWLKIVRKMPPRRNRVNNEVDPAFAAAVEQAVAALLPNLTARITDEIHQNENNANQRNGRRGSRNDGDAQPTDIHVWLERKLDSTYREDLRGFGMRRSVQGQYFPYSEKERCEREYKSIRQLPEETSTDFMKRFLRLAAQVANAATNIKIFCDRPKNEGDNKRDRDGHRIRPSETPSQGSNPRADDRRDSDRYGNCGRHGNMDKYGTDRWRGDRQGSDRHDNGSDRRGNGKACHKATGACFECGEVRHLAKDCKNGSTSGGGKRFVLVPVVVIVELEFALLYGLGFDSIFSYADCGISFDFAGEL